MSFGAFHQLKMASKPSPCSPGQEQSKQPSEGSTGCGRELAKSSTGWLAQKNSHNSTSSTYSRNNHNSITSDKSRMSITCSDKEIFLDQTQTLQRFTW